MSRHGAVEPGSSIRESYLMAAHSAVGLLEQPRLRELWSAPSALAEFAVSGLAGHLAGQVHQVRAVLDAPVPAGTPIPLLDHYREAAWREADLNSAANTGIREAGEAYAAAGPDALVERTQDVLDVLAVELGGNLDGRVVHLPWVGWSLTLDDYLVTRMMEISVHSDDLAVSIGIETPALPRSVTAPVLDLLVNLSELRHGSTALLRALSRAERAPASIAAI